MSLARPIQSTFLSRRVRVASYAEFPRRGAHARRPAHCVQLTSSVRHDEKTISIKMTEKPEAPEGKYPAKAHCEKVAEFLRNRGASMDGMLYLEGARQQNWEDSDCEAPFRSDPASGVLAAAARAHDVADSAGPSSTSAASRTRGPCSATTSRPRTSRC